MPEFEKVSCSGSRACVNLMPSYVDFLQSNVDLIQFYVNLMQSHVQLLFVIFWGRNFGCERHCCERIGKGMDKNTVSERTN